MNGRMDKQNFSPFYRLRPLLEPLPKNCILFHGQGQGQGKLEGHGQWQCRGKVEWHGKESAGARLRGMGRGNNAKTAREIIKRNQVKNNWKKVNNVIHFLNFG